MGIEDDLRDIKVHMTDLSVDMKAIGLWCRDIDTKLMMLLAKEQPTDRQSKEKAIKDTLVG